MENTESIQIYLDSRYAQKRDGNAGNAYFQISNIYVEDGYHIHLGLVNLTMPYSFYNVNTSNNVLTWDYIGNPQQNFTVPVGNYTIHQLVQYLNANWTGFTVYYNGITNKVTVSNSAQFTIYSSGFARLLGFTGNGYSTGAGPYTVGSQNCVNLYTITQIQVETNLLTYNVSNTANKTNNRNILASIPVSCAPFGLIVYENPSQYKTNLYVGEFNYVEARLLDNNGNVIDMNGCDYCMTLQLDIIPFR